MNNQEKTTSKNYARALSKEELIKTLQERFYSLEVDRRYHMDEMEHCTPLMKELHEVSIAHIDTMKERLSEVLDTYCWYLDSETLIILKNESYLETNSREPFSFTDLNSIYDGDVTSVSYIELMDRLAMLRVELKQEISEFLTEDGNLSYLRKDSTEELDEVEMNYIVYCYTLLAMRNLASHDMSERFMLVHNREDETVQVYDVEGHLIFMLI